MAPSPQAPVAGIFVQNQVDELAASGQFEHLKFLAIRSVQRGPVGLLKKYGHLLWSIFTKAILSRRRYDVVHVHYFYPTIFFALFYKWFRNPKAKIMVTFHGSDIYSFTPPGRLYRFAAKYIDKAIFVSDGLKARFHRKDQASAVISAGILPCFEQQRQTKAYDLVMVGSVDQNKGIDRLKLILEKTEQPLRILIAGDGPMVEALKSWQFEQHQLTVAGRCTPKALVPLMNQSRFLLSLSRHESFGLVMTEAMACGTPVIATATDGAKAQVREGHNGFLIDAQTDVVDKACEVIGNALFELDGQGYQQLSNNAVQSAQQHKLSSVVDALSGEYRLMFERG